MKQWLAVGGIAYGLRNSRGWITSSVTLLRQFACGLIGVLALPLFAAAPPAALATNDPLCLVPVIGSGKQGPGTLRMVARLQEIKRKADPRDSAYMSEESAARSRVAKLAATNVHQLASIQIQLALQLLRSGKSADAIQEFDDVHALFQKHGLEVSPADRVFLELQRGIAFLRLGEQENCLLNHNSDSCLFPIEGGGIHKLPRGSRGAIEIFSRLHQAKPNLGARWLLNIAYMTLGEYPAKVPSPLLIPPRVFESDYNLPRFPEAAAAAGLDVDDLAGGCITDDFDGDGLLDVMASAWSLSGQIRFFHNNGNGTFTERTREAGLMGLTGSLNILQTDYNNDGHVDVFML
ncbi:MAG TPA: VCBS repeat-containing protein, partial [Candidatus Acidoferrum sp.]|nr:VCBS repeat-containing protein [Candidatus Acidoferrum sp.]